MEGKQLLYGRKLVRDCLDSFLRGKPSKIGIDCGQLALCDQAEVVEELIQFAGLLLLFVLWSVFRHLLNLLLEHLCKLLCILVVPIAWQPFVLECKLPKCLEREMDQCVVSHLIKVIDRHIGIEWQLVWKLQALLESFKGNILRKLKILSDSASQILSKPGRVSDSE